MLRFAKIETVGFRTYGHDGAWYVNYFYDVMMTTFEHSGWLALAGSLARGLAASRPPGRQLHFSFAA